MFSIVQISFNTDDINWYLSTAYVNWSKSFEHISPRTLQNYPFIFKSVDGICQHALGYNWYNEAEIDETICMVRDLLTPDSDENATKQITQSDIGIITPYYIQCYKIAQLLREIGMDGITVGTAETFQGMQKNIMVISTVRSSNEPFDFDEPPKKLDFIAPFAKSQVSRKITKFFFLNKHL